MTFKPVWMAKNKNVTRMKDFTCEGIGRSRDDSSFDKLHILVVKPYHPPEFYISISLLSLVRSSFVNRNRNHNRSIDTCLPEKLKYYM